MQPCLGCKYGCGPSSPNIFLFKHLIRTETRHININLVKDSQGFQLLGLEYVSHTAFFLFWGSVRSPLIFNVLHQHRPHMVPDLHANKSPASTAKHMNPDLHANESPASTAKHTYHLHCTQLNYKTQKHYMTECKCSLCSLMPVKSFPNLFLLQMQHRAGGHNVQKSNCFPF